MSITLTQASVCYRRYPQPWSLVWEWLSHKPQHESMYALKDLNLHLKQSSTLGIVGDNGAGKSTLLRLLAGTLPPSSGQCVIQGKRAALLELGVGLQPNLSGLDNIQLGLALRGLSQADIKHYTPQVLEFAELENVAHHAVKTYSSGMTMRMGFALATVVAPEILIVDEALAVGDQYFQKKSLERLRDIVKQGATLIFCSHNLYQVREMCESALWLEAGQLHLLGEAQAVVDAYQDACRARSKPVLVTHTPTSLNNSSQPYLAQVSLLPERQPPIYYTEQRFAVQVEIALNGYAVADVHVGIVIRRNDEVQCYGISTLHDRVALQGADTATVQYVIERLPLLAGQYCLEVWLIDGSGLHVYDARERCCHFSVQQASQTQGIGVCQIPHRWEVLADAMA